jgi:gamma-glutamyltranspeptidase/glutathione hydrolase
MTTYTRREVLDLAARALLAGAMAPQRALAAETRFLSSSHGAIAGEPTAARVGAKILASGGNAVDAIVAAALAAGVASPHSCGVGGYGGHMVLALAGGKKIIAIDFNSAAPAAAREDMYPLNAQGAVKGDINRYGWLAVGVPGTLAGLQLALDRYGTRSLPAVAAPAIELAREGFPISPSLAGSLRNHAARLRKNPAIARLLLKNGKPLQAGDILRNTDLATLLETLAGRKSVESFYRGDIARRIAQACQKHGGLITAKDLADYQAREVEPLRLTWHGYEIHTAPLTAGGITPLEALLILKALKWNSLPATPLKTHARLEALRVAWHDRLALLGDPEKVKVPVDRLLSDEYARGAAARIEAAVEQRKPLAFATEHHRQTGTIHLSCADRQGNLVALTLTHGEAFGACVAVDGLGVILGHGMSRFDAKPGHSNSPGPGKRPLHNMCPTIVLRDGRPVLALGGAGGRTIPNALFDVLSHYVCSEATLEEAIAAPRLHTEGNLEVRLESNWPPAEANYLKTLGYVVQSGASARVSAAAFDPKTGKCRSAAR